MSESAHKFHYEFVAIGYTGRDTTFIEIFFIIETNIGLLLFAETEGYAACYSMAGIVIDFQFSVISGSAVAVV